MKLMMQIVLQEVKRMFCSPIIWLLLGVFMIQVAYSHTNNFLMFAGFKETLPRMISGLTAKLFGVNHIYGLFGSLLNSAFLYIPLITMSSFSAEYDKGTYKLIQTVPIKDVQVVGGKFGALVVYSILLILVAIVLTLICSLYIPNLEYKYILGGLLSFFLLINSFLAIGLFVSSLTSSQVIAALVTFSVLGLLRILSGIGQSIPYLSDVLYWISLSDRAAEMMNGLISSRNVIYFLLIIFFFLGLTVIRLSTFRNELLSRLNVFRFSVFCTIVILIGWFSSDPYHTFYVDITKDKYRTVSKQIQEYAQELREDELELNTYINLLNKWVKLGALPTQRNADKNYFEPYVRFLPNLKFNHYYFYDTLPSNLNLYNQNKGLSTRQIAHRMASAYGIPQKKLLSPGQISNITDLGTEGNQYVRELIYNDRRSFLRMYDDQTNYPTEREVGAALMNLVNGPIKVGLVQGHSERSTSKEDEDYYWILDAREDNRASLRNEGYDFKPMTLNELVAVRDIDLLIIADPLSPYSKMELDHLRQYIDDGGNILFAFEPKNDVTANQLLGLLGLQLTGNALPPNQKEYGEDLILADVDHALYKMEIRPNYRFWPRYRKVFLNSASYLVQDSVPKDFEMDSFLSIQSNEEVDSNKSSRRNIAVGLSRHHQNKQQRIFVIADADFLSNKAQRQVVNNTSNLTELIYPIFDWLSYTEIPPRPPQMNRDNQFSLAKEGANGFRFIMLYVFPSCFFIMGAAFLIIRRRK